MTPRTDESKPELTPQPAETPGPTAGAESLPPPKPPGTEPDWTDPRFIALTPGPFIQTPVQEPFNWGWLVYRIVMVGLILGVIASGVWYVQGLFEKPMTINTGKGSLVVVVVLDHLSGELLEEWRRLLDGQGLERMRQEGVSFSDVHWPYALTEPVAGYASISTGVPPADHGITGPSWYDRDSGTWRRTENAEQLLVPTIPDILRQERPKSRSFSLALKSSAAAFLGGTSSTRFHYESETGQFRCNSARELGWLERFNAAGVSRRWENKDWTRLPALPTADEHAGPDQHPFEGRWFGESNSFPHAMKQNAAYFQRLPHTPFGNELLMELAKTTIEEEKLGDEQIDLLWLSLSGTEKLSELFGPKSHEMLDSLMRTDRLIASLQDFLRQRFGSRSFTLIVTSSSGLAPLPERLDQKKSNAQRFPIAEEYATLESALDAAFGRADDQPQTWLRPPITETFPWLYWNQSRRQNSGIPAEVIDQFARKWLENRSPTARVLNSLELASEPATEKVIRQAQLSYHPQRSGDWLILTRPHAIADAGQNQGTRSGSPYSYDTHIPLLAMGQSIPKLGTHSERCDGLIVAPLICKALGITPLKSMTTKLPNGF